MLKRLRISEKAAIQDRLDSDETLVSFSRQSRFKPGGAMGVTPNTIYLTTKRVIIRNPIRLGFGENIEDYYYNNITNVRLEKGILSASIVLFVRGMTEISKTERNDQYWGRNAPGTIDGIPKDKAEEMYAYIRKQIDGANVRKRGADADGDKTSGFVGVDPAAHKAASETAITILRKRYAAGEITADEFDAMKANLDKKTKKK